VLSTFLHDLQNLNIVNSNGEDGELVDIKL
jgi:hypothetical protein